MSKVLTSSNKFLMRGGRWLTREYVPPEPPTPVLPLYTIRLRFTEGVTPTFSNGTGVQVSSSPNIWDLTYRNSNWLALLRNQVDLLEVIDGNTAGVTSMHSIFLGCTGLTSVQLFNTSSVTNMTSMFNKCSSLTSVPRFDTSKCTNMTNLFLKCASLRSVPLLDTSKCTNMTAMFGDCTGLTSVPLFNTSSASNLSSMFNGCTRLTSVPLFNTSSATDMDHMFYRCTNVESGALALYQRASSQATVPTHDRTFFSCGSNTVTGAAELAQIPSDWK